jgi:hypothetical protein
VALTGLLAALALPAGARAAVSDVFRPYLATVKATETLTWSTTPDSNCYGYRGGGVEEISFATSRPVRVLAMFGFGHVRDDVEFNGWRLITSGRARLSGPLAVTRRDDTVPFGAPPGDFSCDPPPPVHDGCGTFAAGTAEMVFRRSGRFALRMEAFKDGQALENVLRRRFANCFGPASHRDVLDRFRLLASPRLSHRTFFSARRTVSAARTFTWSLSGPELNDQRVTVTDAMRWEVSLRAVGRRRVQCSGREFPPRCLR